AARARVRVPREDQAEETDRARPSSRRRAVVRGHRAPRRRDAGSGRQTRATRPARARRAARSTGGRMTDQLVRDVLTADDRLDDVARARVCSRLEDRIAPPAPRAARWPFALGLAACAAAAIAVWMVRRA